MRSKNAIKNLILHLFYEVIVFGLGIIFPHFIISIYGSAINGLTATITRILSLINLIQAGAVGAAIFQMYKPVAENDYETQSAIIYSSRRFYNIVSVIYLTAALVAGVFYSFYLQDDSLRFGFVFLSFAILAVNGASTLLFNSIYDIYVSPHQKKYYLSIALIAEQVVRYALLAFVLFLKLHFVFIYVCYFCGGITSVILQTIFYKILSKGKITSNPLNKNFKIPNRKYLMMASIGSEAVVASPTIIITTALGLVYSSVFSLYSMVFTSMKTVLNSIQLSFSAIFGNLTKTANDEHIYSVYSTIELITLFLGTICSACVAFLLIPFVDLYTYGISDVEYVYPLLAIFVTLCTMFFAFRTSFSFVATVYGLFKHTCKIILVFGLTGIALSIICTIFFGLPFVMVGLLFNEIGCSVFTLIVLKKNILWFKTRKLLVRSSLMAFLTILSLVVYFILKPLIESWTTWLLCAVIVASIIIVVLMFYCLIFERKQIKVLLTYLKNLFSK